MSKKLTAVAALAVVAIAGVLLVTNPFSKAPVASQTQSSQLQSSLPQLTQQAIQSATKPLVIVVTGANCASCPDLLKQVEAQVAKQPGVTFMHADAAAIGAPDTALPVLLVVVPGLPMPSFAQPKFTAPADFDAFIAQRVANATEEQAAVKALEAVQAQIDAKAKPFDDELAAIETNANAALAPIQTKANEAIKDLKAKAQEIAARRNAAIAPLIEEAQKADSLDKALEVQTKIAAASKPFEVEMVPVQAQLRAALAPFQAEAAKAVAPFQAQAKEVNTRRTAAVESLEADFAKAEEALGKLLQEHAPKK